jgi:hypothetical protein
MALENRKLSNFTDISQYNIAESLQSQIYGKEYYDGYCDSSAQPRGDYFARRTA